LLAKLWKKESSTAMMGSNDACKFGGGRRNGIGMNEPMDFPCMGTFEESFSVHLPFEFVPWRSHQNKKNSR